MKLAKRFLAIALTLSMLACGCIVANAATTTATVSFSTVSTTNVSNGVTYTKYNITGSVCADTAASYVLEFNPDDGAVPLAYAAYGGANLPFFKTQVNQANAAGYEVLGAINGSFFTGVNLIGTVVEGGRITVTDAAISAEPMGTFTSTDEFKHVYSTPAFTVTADGQTFANGLAAVNKSYSYAVGKNSDFANRFFYYDRYAKSGVTGTVTGYEIICKKLDYTELAFGQTLKGEVVSVTSTTYGANRPTDDDTFALFMPASSSNVSYASGLAAGDIVTVTATDNGGYADILADSYSAISSVYWLVYNGVDQTNIYDTICHSVTSERAWTAFGVKEDGSYVYFVSEEGGLTLKDVAAAMMDMGCVNVARLDGGGSSAMYNSVDGVVYLAETTNYSSGRPIPDVLLIVSKESMYDEALANELQEVLDIAKTVNTTDETLLANIAAAESLLSQTYPAKGEVKELLSKLSLKSVVSSFIDAAKAENSAYYTETDYATLQSAITDAEAVVASDTATNEDYKASIESLSAALELSKFKVVSEGADYTITAGTNYNYWGGTTLLHDDGIRLTDGAKSTSGTLTASYSAWTKANNPVVAVVDLGAETETNTYSIYTCGGFWGIQNCIQFTVEGSNDNSTFTSIGTGTTVTEVGDGDNIEGTVSKLYSLTFSTDTVQSYRYLRFSMNVNGNFLWVDEIEAAYDGTLVTDSGESGEVTPPVDETPDYVLGDINNDGSLNVADYMMLKRIILGAYSMESLEVQETAALRCDIDGDGTPNVPDYLMLRRAILTNTSLG